MSGVHIFTGATERSSEDLAFEAGLQAGAGAEPDEDEEDEGYPKGGKPVS